MNPIMVCKIHRDELTPALRAMFATNSSVLYDRMAGNHRTIVDEVFRFVFQHFQHTLKHFQYSISWPAFVLKNEIVEDGVQRQMYKEKCMIFADSENKQEQNMVVPTSSFEIISVCTYL